MTSTGERLRFRLPAVAVTGLALLGALILATPGPARAAAATLPVIPAVQQWTAGAGSYQYGTGTRIVLDPASAAALAGDAATFADDLATLKGTRPAVVTAEPAGAAAGDIVLALVETAPGPEGYQLDVGAVLRVSAESTDGLFHGTRTVLQLLRRGGTVPAGTALDWAQYETRGLNVDVGRKFYSPAWLAAQVREASYLKLNRLHLHLSDNEGFRIESDNLKATSPALSKQQVRTLLALAARYHVTVVPEIDMPAHLEKLLEQHQDWRLQPSTGRPEVGRVDLSNPVARGFLLTLVREYLELFPGPVWHLGADEYLKDYSRYPQLDGPDALRRFINDVNALVTAQDRVLEVWSSEALVLPVGSVALDPGVRVEFWSRGSDPDFVPEDLDGHDLVNANNERLYGVLGSTRAGAEPASVYSLWNPALFSGNTPPPPGQTPLGAELSIWSDLPGAQDEADVSGWAVPRLRVLAQATWGSPKPSPDYPGFESIGSTIGHAPGWVAGEGRIAQLNRLAVNRNADGRMVIVQARGGALMSLVQRGPNSGFDAFSPIAGTAGMRAPVLVPNNDGRLELFAVGDDDLLYHCAQTSQNGSFGPWQGFSDPMPEDSNPVRVSEDFAVGRNADGRLQVVAVAQDGRLVTISQAVRNGAWAHWWWFGGSDLHSLHFGVDADARLELFGVDGKGVLQQNWQTSLNGEWAGWSARPDADRLLTRDLAVARNADGRLQVFATTAGTGQVDTFVQKSANGSWEPAWTQLAGTDVHSPAVTAEPDGRLTLFVVGGNGQLFRKTQTAANSGGSFGGWIGMAGTELSRDLVVGTNADRRLQPFVVGNDGRTATTIWQSAASATGWSGWLPLTYPAP